MSFWQKRAFTSIYITVSLQNNFHILNLFALNKLNKKRISKEAHSFEILFLLYCRILSIKI